MVFATRITQSVCNQINRDLDISALAVDITSSIDTWDSYYVGGFVGGFDLAVTDSLGLEGQHAGCMIDDNGHYVYYHVLLAR